MNRRIKFIDGSGGGLINRYALQPYRNKYLKMGCVIYDGTERIELPLPEHCETCKRKFSSTRNKSIFLCPNLTVNKQLGHVGRICVDCNWYYEKENGAVPPKTISEFFATGFRPHLL